MGWLLCVLIPTLLISGFAQLWVRSAVRKWGQQGNSAGINGIRTAEMIMRNYELAARLEVIPQTLGDHFDPRNQTVRLSGEIAHQPSITAMAIAAHEFGHVQQYAQKSPLIAARTFVLPVARYGDSAAFIMILIGLWTNFLGLAWLGLILFSAAVLFTILTLPVEFDASRRAMKMLDEMGVLHTREDRAGAQAVLRAAAFTYVAAMAVAVLNLAYYAMLIAGASRD